MARIGQIFSGTKHIAHLEEDDLEEIEDIKRNDFCFTDGAGNISTEIAAQIDNDYGLKQCSAYQVRIGGLKGVLVHDDKLEGNKI